MQTVKGGFRHLLAIVGLYLLSILLPNRGKRIIMLTTLHARLVRDGVFHAETLQKLNDSLFLASTPTALTLPASIYGRVWDTNQLHSILNEIDGKYDGDTCLLYADARKVSQSIISLTPAWLRYGSVDDMMRDVMSLFYCKSLTLP